MERSSGLATAVVSANKPPLPASACALRSPHAIVGCTEESRCRASWMQTIRNPARRAICKPLHDALLSDKIKPISDRIAFALWSRRNRTARVPSREKRCKAHLQRSAGLFLRSGFRVTIAKLRPFPAISREIQAVFSALQTVWRREWDSNPRYPFE
jgi:hypothetical protein